MSRFGAEYQVGRFTGRCSATGRALQPGSTCVTALCERADDEGFDRLDYSAEAWDAGARPERLFSHWKTVVPAHDAKPRLLVDNSVLLDLFERLGSDPRPQRTAFRFVLALILMRKKLLRFTGREIVGEQEAWLLQPRGAAESDRPPLRVINPQLTDDDVRTMMDQLGEILQSEL